MFLLRGVLTPFIFTGHPPINYHTHNFSKLFGINMIKFIAAVDTFFSFIVPGVVFGVTLFAMVKFLVHLNKQEND